LSTNSTTSQYINLIDITYPVAGQDNNSQGFRDNFKNITSALSSADQDIYNLKLNSVVLNQTNDFDNNVVKRAQFQNCSTLLLDNSQIVQISDVVVDYSAGSYQKYIVAAGTHLFTINNLPDVGQSGDLILSISPSDPTQTPRITFPTTYKMLNGYINPTIGILVTGTTPTLIQIISESGAVYVRILNSINFGQGFSVTDQTVSVNALGAGIQGTATIITAYNSLGVGTSLITTGTNGTLVTSVGSQYGAIALAPNQIIATPFNGPGGPYNAVNGVSSSVKLTSVAGIQIGATVVHPTSGALLTVSAIDTVNKIVTITSFTVGSGLGNSITFTNARFTGQVPALTLVSTRPASTASGAGEAIGQVYADGNTLFLNYTDYSQGNQNKIQISSDTSGNPRVLGNASTATTQTLYDKSNLVATDQFVWNAITATTTVVAYAITATNATTATTMVQGANGWGKRTISYTTPSAGSYGDIWYQII
jgi:hypothetical protein